MSSRLLLRLWFSAVLLALRRAPARAPLEALFGARPCLARPSNGEMRP